MRNMAEKRLYGAAKIAHERKMARLAAQQSQQTQDDLPEAVAAAQNPMQPVQIPQNSKPQSGGKSQKQPQSGGNAQNPPQKRSWLRWEDPEWDQWLNM